VNARRRLSIGSLCTGYGGLDLAVRAVLGGQLAWVADNDPACTRLLQTRFPRVPNLGDITTVDWATVRPVDVITAGFPCVDTSNAGKRAGIHGPRSGVWRDVAAAVRVLRPRFVFVENVAALRARGLDTVLADLHQGGYDATWLCLRAADVDAAHRRDRLFLLATPACRS
jgi:DNA (cytosine-5)-methyltransferase 1